MEVFDGGCERTEPIGIRAAVAVALVLIGAIVGIVIAVSAGQSETVLGIALIGGGLLCAAALC